MSRYSSLSNYLFSYPLYIPLVPCNFSFWLWYRSPARKPMINVTFLCTTLIFNIATVCSSLSFHLWSESLGSTPPVPFGTSPIRLTKFPWAALLFHKCHAWWRACMMIHFRSGSSVLWGLKNLWDALSTVFVVSRDHFVSKVVCQCTNRRERKVWQEHVNSWVQRLWRSKISQPSQKFNRSENHHPLFRNECASQIKNVHWGIDDSYFKLFFLSCIESLNEKCIRKSSLSSDIRSP